MSASGGIHRARAATRAVWSTIPRSAARFERTHLSRVRIQLHQLLVLQLLGTLGELPVGERLGSVPHVDCAAVIERGAPGREREAALEVVTRIVAREEPSERLRQVDAAVRVALALPERTPPPVWRRRDLLEPSLIGAVGDRAVATAIADAVEQVGEDGVIVLQETQTPGISVEVVEGMQFDEGFLPSDGSVRTQSNTVVMDDARVLLCDFPLEEPEDVQPFLDAAAAQERPMLVVVWDANRPCRNRCTCICCHRWIP